VAALQRLQKLIQERENQTCTGRAPRRWKRCAASGGRRAWRSSVIGPARFRQWWGEQDEHEMSRPVHRSLVLLAGRQRR
jgi:hypothetical protein